MFFLQTPLLHTHVMPDVQISDISYQLPNLRCKGLFINILHRLFSQLLRKWDAYWVTFPMDNCFEGFGPLYWSGSNWLSYDRSVLNGSRKSSHQVDAIVCAFFTLLYAELPLSCLMRSGAGTSPTKFKTTTLQLWLLWSSGSNFYHFFNKILQKCFCIIWLMITTIYPHYGAGMIRIGPLLFTACHEKRLKWSTVFAVQCDLCHRMKGFWWLSDIFQHPFCHLSGGAAK